MSAYLRIKVEDNITFERTLKATLAGALCLKVSLHLLQGT